MANNWNTSTDDYDIYGSQGSPNSLPGSPSVDASGHLTYDDYFFPMSTTPNSMMDQDPNNTGPTNDFWTDYPISIDINGYIFYNGENTGINVRGPAGTSAISWDDLTPAQKASLKGQDGQDGRNGTNGRDGTNGADGADAYHVWLEDMHYSEAQHPIDEFYQYIANLCNNIIKEGTGNGSLILNYKGNNNTASGVGALATGNGTSASGLNSFTAGLGTKSSHNYQFSIGKYNEDGNNLFEIGYGVSDITRRNVFYVNSGGNIWAKGEIVDGSNNILSNKVDKISGKSLSTNDFTNTYKNFLDNYQIDTVVSSSSTNPVQNRAIYNAIEQVRIDNGKPTQAVTTSNVDYGFFFVADTSSGTLNEAKFNTNLAYNPNKQSLKKGITSTNSNIIGFGNYLSSASDYQLIFGQYNNPTVDDLVEIGWGTSQQLKNVFTVDKIGNLTVTGAITDGNGVTFADKQDVLEYDTVPTQNSLKIVNSGDLYTYIQNNILDQISGFNRRISALESSLTSALARITALETAVAAIGNPREITDDTYVNNVYTYGIDQDEFYIKLIRPQPEPEPEDDDEEEEGE